MGFVAYYIHHLFPHFSCRFFSRPGTLLIALVPLPLCVEYSLNACPVTAQAAFGNSQGEVPRKVSGEGFPSQGLWVGAYGES